MFSSELKWLKKDSPNFLTFFSRSPPYNVLDFPLLTLGVLSTEKPLPWFEGIPRWISGGSQLVLCWSLAALVVQAAYGGNLLASLVGIKQEPPIDTLEVTDIGYAYCTYV